MGWFMPKQLTEFTLSSIKTVLRTVHEYGVTFIISVLVIVIVAASITGYISFPWQIINDHVDAKGDEIIEAMGQQHSAFFSQERDRSEAIIKAQNRATSATIQNCRITARANHMNETDCGL